MSSNNAEEKATGKRSWSITTRLSVLYALSAFGLLILATSFLYWVLTDTLEREDHQLLVARIHDLRIVLREHPEAEDSELLFHEIQREGGGPGLASHYARILDASGQTLLETTGMEQRVAARDFPTPISLSETDSPSLMWQAPDGSCYLLMSTWAGLGKLEQPVRQIQVALDVSQEEALLVAYRRYLAWVLLLGTLLSAGLGVLVARRGLRPLAEITQTVERITATRLHERVGSASWPKELASLAVAFDSMLERLSGSFERLSQFSADLAHELRTPINNLMGETEVALARDRSLEDYARVLESNMEEYAKLSRMIDGLLFLARSASMQTRIEGTRFAADKELDAIRDYFEPVADEADIKIICTGQAEISAEPLLFKRAIGNLVINAIHYTPRGGTIVLSVRKNTDQSIEVSVQDNGCGIAAEHLPKLFERFYRVDAARAQQPEGMGLGLAIVKSIMERHGGQVTIESEPGKGTIVGLHFPPPFQPR